MSKKDNNKNLQFKTVDFNVLECKEENIDGVECYSFKGYGATFGNVDLGDDVCAKGCFEKSLIKKQPILMWQHDSDQPLGVFKVCKEDEKGLYVEGCMPKADTLVSGRIYPQMKIGSIKKMSIGFNTVDAEIIKGEKGTYRLLKELDLWEVSLVTFAMNPEAEVTDVKTAIEQFKTISDVSRLLKKHFTKSESDDIIFAIKKFSSCNENDNPCNEDDISEVITTEVEAYIESLKSLTKEN